MYFEPMKTNEIVNEIARNIESLPVWVCASMISYCFVCDKRTAQKALDILADRGTLKKDGCIYYK